MQPYVPIGTLYAATALRDCRISVAVFDAMLNPPADTFQTMLHRQQPKIVVVYEDDFNFLSKMCLTRMREVAWEIAKASREIGAVVVVHGSDSTDNPALFLANGFDYVLCGEAEDVLATLCRSILTKAEIPELDGLVMLDLHGQIAESPQRLAKNPAWAQLSSPARDLIDLEQYRSAWLGAHGYFSTNMVASRGCPYRCNWCAKPISGNRFHLREASTVAEEMAMLKQFGVEHVWFGDDVFALNHHWVKQFAEEITKRGGAIPFKVQSRADLMREDTVLHLKAAGCAEVWMGVESGSQAILDAMDKGIAAGHCRSGTAAAERCRHPSMLLPASSVIRARRGPNSSRRLLSFESLGLTILGFRFRTRCQELSSMNAYRRNSGQNATGPKSATISASCSRLPTQLISIELCAKRCMPRLTPGIVLELTTKSDARVNQLWKVVHEMEPSNRASDPFEFPKTIGLITSLSFVPIEQLTSSGRN